MSMTEKNSLPNQVNVQTLHVLADGRIIQSLDAFEAVQDRFAWIDRNALIERILKLRSMTEANKKSFLVYYEKDQQVAEHLNVEDGVALAAML